jgi:protocatechuate 3,4-dioxygenase beta subunit
MLTRRDLLSKAIALGVVSAATLLPSQIAEAWDWSDQHPRTVTPPAELGPFYKRDAPKVTRLSQTGDPGLPLHVTGQVFNARGDVFPGATIEIWHADHEGHYDLRGYRFRSTLTSGEDGKYEFTSVMPGHYPARVCQHVHYLVTAPGCKPLVTQLYFATDPAFAGDPDRNYTRDPLIWSRELVRHVTINGDPKQMTAVVRFELVLDRL